jgi:membrane fusion protein, heavy metal efflux system
MITCIARNRILAISLLAALVALAGCGERHAEDEHGDGHEEAAAQVQKGPHGGRLLEDGDFALEITIFERGVPPEFRLYPTVRGKPVPLQGMAVTMELTRVTGVPGGVVDRHIFLVREDHLHSAAEVYEPHSFTVKVQATHGGKTHIWTYDSPEGRVTMLAETAGSQGVATAIAGPGVVGETLPLYGRIQPNAERRRAVHARFQGMVQDVSVQVGDAVKAGQVLANVESNESLRSYAVTAPIAGTVVSRNVNPGEATGSAALFEIANFGSVWAELSVFPRDRTRLKGGQVVEVAATDGAARGTGRISHVSPVGTASQSLVARVVLDNSGGQWTPGQFVNGTVTVAQSRAALLVPVAALQTFRDWDVVAVNDGELYQLQPVELGRRDGANVEVLSGLAPGARVVTANSYLVKADVEKSGASHDH